MAIRYPIYSISIALQVHLAIFSLCKPITLLILACLFLYSGHCNSNNFSLVSFHAGPKYLSMTASFIYIILFIYSLALKTGPLSRSTHLGLVYLSYRHILASNALFYFPYRPFSLFLFFLSFFLSFFFLFYYMPITLSILASCNFFRSNNFLASLAFIQAHSIYPIMASFLYTEQILFVRFPVGFGDRPVMSFNSFRPR